MSIAMDERFAASLTETGLARDAQSEIKRPITRRSSILSRCIKVSIGSV